MAGKSLETVFRHVRKLAVVQTSRGLSDRELLARFLEANDESAFAALVERHGPMVLGVCRRALRNHHDAEDACQATFLVLARKAASVRKQTSLSSWLHGVACRTASNLRREQQRRHRRERGVEPPAPSDAGEVSWQEVQAILDEELERLPERYRSPLVLCYLDGKTRDEAAERLGLRPGTLHGRLERGRELLRKRLTARGLTLGAALFATTLGTSVAHAALSPTLVLSSARAALLLAAGNAIPEGLVSGTALTLTQEVLRNMFVAKLKVGTATALCACLLAALLVGSLASTGQAQTPRDPKRPATAAAKAEGDEEFIRRISQDLRGKEPTPTEVHFFVATKDAGKRQKLIDLFIQERQALQAAAKKKDEGIAGETILTVEPGDSFLRPLTTKAQELMRINGNEVVQRQGQTFLFSFTPVKHDGTNWTVKQKIEWVKMTLDIGGNKIEFDSTKPQVGGSPLADFYKALVGTEFTLTIDKGMKVIKIEGREKLIERLVKANPQMKRLLEDILSEKVVKEMADMALAGVELTLIRDKDEKVKRYIRLTFPLRQDGDTKK